ncbi:NAD-dependent epimerase/dehydratase family protein [Streptomyces sp. NPDC059455]|uniref:NAD-dependent epimerase/dehydratase family protein n=1 Tax=Streptomyces sp. NPDC059455 TaxID=3346837 RepID=UPI0036A88B50
MAHVLITGGSGLIGWRVVESLVELGHDVVVLDSQPNHANLEPVADKITVVAGSVTDLPTILRVMKRHHVDHVIHLAALVTQFALRDPAAAFQVNTLGTANIFEAADALEAKRVVWTSSVTALSAPDDYDNTLVAEEYPRISTHPYGASKFGAEIVANRFVQDRGLDIIGIRPALVYGIGRLGGGAGLFNEAVRRLALEKSTELLGSSTLHQPIYNKDMAQLLVQALFVDRPEHHLFNVPTLKAYTNEELEAELSAAFPDADVRVAPAPDYIPKVPAVDGSRAQRELGFTPRYSLVDGVRELVDLFRGGDATTDVRPSTALPTSSTGQGTR